MIQRNDDILRISEQDLMKISKTEVIEINKIPKNS